MKRFILSVLVMVVSFGAFGQTKLDLTLSRLVREAAESKARTGKAGQMVKVCAVLADGAVVPEARLGELGVRVLHSAYGIVDMVVPVGALSALDGIEEFSAYEAPKTCELMDAASNKADYVDQLQDAAAAKEQGLPSTYDGSGVIVGVFDSGIDYNHANFRNPVKKTSRVKKAVLFRNFSEDNGPFVDGTKEFDAGKIVEVYTDSAQIDTISTDSRYAFHGSHTAGIAAGGYNGEIISPATKKARYQGQRGVAYNSELILSSAVKVHEEFERRALEEMANYADTAQRPLVVNLSVGRNFDWMDGKIAICKFFDKFTENGTKPGRIVCLSASNAGDESYTMNKRLDESNDYTIRAYLARRETGTPFILSRIFFYCSDTTQVEVSAEYWQDNNGTMKIKGSISDEVLKGKNWLASNWDAAHDNRFHGEFVFSVDGYLANNPNDYVVIKIKSKYNHPCSVRMFQLDGADSSIHRPFMINHDKGFESGDATSSFNVCACTNSVLSVGSWNNNGSWYDMNDTLRASLFITEDYPLNDVTYFSSFTDADDNGVARPDFCAPGMAVISGVNMYDTVDILKNNEANSLGVAAEDYGRKDGMHSFFGIDSGTSMACPNAAGIIALWLQANPKLCVNDVRDVIRHTADWGGIKEGHRYRAGAGRINALAGLKYILEHYPTDIQDIVDGQPKGLVETEAKKVLEDGRLVIVRGGVKYSVEGMKIK